MAGTLSVMIGGEAEHVQKAEVLIKCFSSNIVHFGPIGKDTDSNFLIVGFMKHFFRKILVRIR